MSIPGLEAVGYQAVGQITNPATAPSTQTFFGGGAWDKPIRKAGLTTAVVLTTFAGFVPPPPAQAGFIFSSFVTPPERPDTKQVDWNGFFTQPRFPTPQFSSFDQVPPQQAKNAWRHLSYSFVSFRTPIPFTGFFDFGAQRAIKPNSVVLQTSWDYFQPTPPNPLPAGGTSRRLPGRTGLEPVKKKPLLPQRIEPQKPTIPLPPFRERVARTIEVPPASVVDPALIPDDLMAMQATIMQAHAEADARRRDEQDIADIADLLAQLDDQDNLD